LIQLGMNHDELQSELEQKEARITELRNQLQARGSVYTYSSLLWAISNFNHKLFMCAGYT